MYGFEGNCWKIMTKCTSTDWLSSVQNGCSKYKYDYISILADVRSKQNNFVINLLIFQSIYLLFCLLLYLLNCLVDLSVYQYNYFFLLIYLFCLFDLSVDIYGNVFVCLSDDFTFDLPCWLISFVLFFIYLLNCLLILFFGLSDLFVSSRWICCVEACFRRKRFSNTQ